MGQGAWIAPPEAFERNGGSAGAGLSHKMTVVCAFRGIWAVISRDLGHAFHGIAGSHFAPVGRLANSWY